MVDHYKGREQTKTKHFILRSYLEELAYKVLQSSYPQIAYVDGFSGPWEARTEDFADTSFMTAITLLRDVQANLAKSGRQKTVKLFFCEKENEPYEQLKTAVAPYHKPQEGFFIETFHGRFQDAVTNIRSFIGSQAFALIFIDPTGWTGYPFKAIAPLLRRESSEVLINFMYDYINRFASSGDPKIVEQLGEILGGSDWVERLDTAIPRGAAVEKLFREVLSEAGQYPAVLSTRIDKSTLDRPHFFIVYGTRHPEGVRTFRDIEYRALSTHERLRQDAKSRKRDEVTGTSDMFAGMDIPSERTVDRMVAAQIPLATEWVLEFLKKSGQIRFERLAVTVMQIFMLRETNCKDMCVSLAHQGLIENSWKAEDKRKRKPDHHHTIMLAKH